MLWILSAACRKEAPPSVAPEAIYLPASAAPTASVSEPLDAATAPVSDRERVVRALAVRDAPPDCATLEGLVADPVAVLLDVVANVSMPPTVPMRAATCLVDGHAEEIGDAMVGWMSSASTRGLAQLAASRLDALPPALALRVARAGLDGENAEIVRGSVEKSSRPEVRSLVSP